MEAPSSPPFEYDSPQRKPRRKSAAHHSEQEQEQEQEPEPEPEPSLAVVDSTAGSVATQDLKRKLPHRNPASATSGWRFRDGELRMAAGYDTGQGDHSEQSDAGHAALASAMSVHGLTQEEQRRLRTKERVRDVAAFALLHDEDFFLAEIDIRARRREQLVRDRAAAKARHQTRKKAREGKMRSQVQGLLDAAGLSAEGRKATSALPDLDALRGLDRARMTKLGLDVADRHKLKAFCQTDEVLQAAVPARVQPPWEDPEVSTEPRRQAIRQAKERHGVRKVTSGIFEFKGEPFGPTGLLYAIGRKGGTQPWANPCTNPDLPSFEPRDGGLWRPQPFGEGGVTVRRSSVRRPKRSPKRLPARTLKRGASPGPVRQEDAKQNFDKLGVASVVANAAVKLKSKAANERSRRRVEHAAREAYGHDAAFVSRQPEEPGECYTEDRFIGGASPSGMIAYYSKGGVEPVLAEYYDVRGSWIAVDLGVGRRLEIDHYALRNDSSGLYALRSWVLEGAHRLDAEKWTTLRRHDFDETLVATTYLLGPHVSVRGAHKTSDGSYAEGDRVKRNIWRTCPASPSTSAALRPAAGAASLLA
eukprot:COSAG04_NODE_1972_length_5105_cov_1.690571_3_plen_588_part_00